MPRKRRSPHAVPWRRLFAEAESARKHAYAPYSRFPVGAAVFTEDGRIIGGCNFENSSYGLSICAERCAVGRAIATGSKQIRALAIVARTEKPCPPCGACRQTLHEFGEADMPIRARDRHGRQSEHTLEQLFPLPFGQGFL
jgi:cytidine deaminase